MNDAKPTSASSFLRLDGHCIACAVNRRAHELTESLLTCKDRRQLHELNRELELLTRFHQQTDFHRLRAENPELAGSRCVDVMLREEEPGGFRISVQAARAGKQEGKDLS